MIIGGTVSALIDVRIQCDGCLCTTIEPATSAWRARARLSHDGWRRISGDDLCPGCIQSGRIFVMPNGAPALTTMCPTCDRIVGAYVQRGGIKLLEPKVSRHHRPGTGDRRIWCSGSGLAISRHAVMERGAA